MKQAHELEAQALLWKHIYGFADSMVLKCALDLGVFDILHRHDRPMTLPELASSLPFPSVDSDRLYRVTRYLAHMKLLHLAQDRPVIAYSLTPASKLLLRGEKRSLASFATLQYYEMEAWHHLSAVVDGTAASPWEKCHGVDYRRYFAEDGRANQLLSDAMTSHTSMVTEALVHGCKTGGMLEGVGSLVDVGGSTGVAAGAIAAAFRGIRCAVFDLPHVIATAPEWPGVARIAGDMFDQVPPADVIFMKVWPYLRTHRLFLVQ